ncbi:MAG TPA: hypothetical protein GX520_11020 [Syntrophaceticus sp.]|nr:hypothetical protein [Syntrophaceticus sp.]
MRMVSVKPSRGPRTKDSAFGSSTERVFHPLTSMAKAFSEPSTKRIANPASSRSNSFPISTSSLTL